MSKPFIYEFLFRGGPTSSPDDDTWHLVLAQEITGVDGEKKLDVGNTLPPDRAAELGFTLDRIVSGINQRSLEVADELRREKANLQQALADSETDRQRLADALAVSLKAFKRTPSADEATASDA